MLTFTIILGILVVILGYTTINLLRKNENSEDIIISQDVFIEQISSQIIESSKRLNEIDEKGSFKSDDEIGWFFEEIKILQNNLSAFKSK
jgi:predicted house-cleaning NTP pyrophosphatase (Maf/HAM1 superfamily)